MDRRDLDEGIIDITQKDRESILHEGHAKTANTLSRLLVWAFVLSLPVSIISLLSIAGVMAWQLPEADRATSVKDVRLDVVTVIDKWSTIAAPLVGGAFAYYLKSRNDRQ